MSFRARHKIPDLGIGVGFRPKHQTEVLEKGGSEHVAWYEVISENFMVPGGRPLHNLDRLRALAPVVTHGVSMGIGGTLDLDATYLRALKGVLDRVQPPYFTDHLCFCRAAGRDLHDLLPLPYTKEAIAHVSERIRRVQGEMQRPFAIENVSSYLTYESSTMTEWQFLAEVAEQAECGILFDVNNVFVSAHNHGFDGTTYVDAIPADRVVQMHLAGHTDKGTYLLDTHSDHVARGVWSLYERAVARTGPVATLIEWDDDIPEWDVLAAEAELAGKHRSAALEKAGK
ncbi:DUF692 domain-containing protein [soil metagenome]